MNAPPNRRRPRRIGWRAARRCVLVVALVLAAWMTAPAEAQGPVLPDRERFHLFLLAGQSDMAGRGDVSPTDREPHPRVLMLTRDGTWAPAVDPMHFDKPDIVGVGPGRAFGLAIAEAIPDITVGLIPAAVGGSPIDAWQPGAYYPPTKSHPWDDALRRARQAARVGTLQGILWHQGESDAKAELAAEYAGKLHALVARWRSALGTPTLPFIAGRLGRFEGQPWDAPREAIDAAHRALPDVVPHTACVSADGLTHKGDGVHFDAASARELGRRYADAYLALTKGR